MSSLRGVWLPIITPFKNGEIDYISYKRLIDHYTTKGIKGLMPILHIGHLKNVPD